MFDVTIMVMTVPAVSVSLTRDTLSSVFWSLDICRRHCRHYCRHQFVDICCVWHVSIARFVRRRVDMRFDCECAPVALSG
jgi:hypothetical protein